MADVTINELTRGTPTGGSILPYSTGSNTLGVPVSALFQGGGSNIGIGLTNPNVTLTINGQLSATGSIACNQNITINNSNYNKTNMGLVNYLGTQAIVAADINNWDNSLRIAGSQDLSYPNTVALYSNNNIRMFVAANGNIKIGSDASPQAKLDVDGSMRVSGAIKLDYTGTNADPYVANIWSQGTLAANSSLSINMNSIAVNFPCAGIWLAFIQTDSPVLNRSGILYKATAMYMGSYMRTLGTNIFNNFTNMYTRDSTSLTIIPPNSNDGQNFSFTNSFTDSTCTYQIRTVPIMSNFRANT